MQLGDSSYRIPWKSVIKSISIHKSVEYIANLLNLVDKSHLKIFQRFHNSIVFPKNPVNHDTLHPYPGHELSLFFGWIPRAPFKTDFVFIENLTSAHGVEEREWEVRIPTWETENEIPKLTTTTTTRKPLLYPWMENSVSLLLFLTSVAIFSEF